MGSAEIARTTDEMAAEMDTEMDAENGGVMDAKIQMRRQAGRTPRFQRPRHAYPL